MKYVYNSIDNDYSIDIVKIVFFFFLIIMVYPKSFNY